VRVLPEAGLVVAEPRWRQTYHRPDPTRPDSSRLVPHALAGVRGASQPFAGIAPASVPGYVVAQLVGLLVGVGLVVALYPNAGAAADAVVVPHEDPETAASRRRPRAELTTDRQGVIAVSEKPSVLFVCVHNAGRSQMAAGWLRHLAGDTVEVRSAGSAPAEAVNPATVEAMAEVGIDITDQTPKILGYEAARSSDVIITMGWGDACPYFPGKRYEDWNLENPAGKGVESVRPIRDEIKTRIENLLADLVSNGVPNR
jgi:arsenate reductase